MIKCKQCGANVPQIQGKKVKQYCNDACKKRYQRANRDKVIGTNHIGTSNRDKSDIKDIKSDKSPTRTKSDKPTPNKHIKGTCYGCGEKQPNPLTEICDRCLRAGKSRKSLGLPPTEHQIWLNECQA